jgi:hypothetical protein
MGFRLRLSFGLSLGFRLRFCFGFGLCLGFGFIFSILPLRLLPVFNCSNFLAP